MNNIEVKMAGKNIKQATHIPLLVKTFELSTGDVLELGTGFFSTILLRWLCEMFDRKLYSVESSNFWYEKIKSKSTSFHKIIKTNKNFDDLDINRKWGMVLIDHFPDERRYKEIEKLANLAEYIVIHDSNLSHIKNYGYEKIWHLFKYRYDYTKLNPNTTVVSNFYDLREFYV